MKVAIMQPYLFPYLGYFQLINAVDKFLLLDDVTYINKGWINRNRICVNGAASYITIPLLNASQNRLINEIEIVNEVKWKEKLEKTIFMNYKKALSFNDFFPVFVNILYSKNPNLSAYISNSIKMINDYLNIATEIIDTTSFYQNKNLSGQERILDLCLKEKASDYINPSGGKMLYSKEMFQKNNIRLNFLNPILNDYPQLHKNEFIAGLSILDVLMNCSKDQVINYLNKYNLD